MSKLGAKWVGNLIRNVCLDFAAAFPKAHSLFRQFKGNILAEPWIMAELAPRCSVHFPVLPLIHQHIKWSPIYNKKQETHSKNLKFVRLYQSIVNVVFMHNCRRQLAMARQYLSIYWQKNFMNPPLVDSTKNLTYFIFSHLCLLAGNSFHVERWVKWYLVPSSMFAPTIPSIQHTFPSLLSLH